MNYNFNTLIERFPKSVINDMRNCEQDYIYHPEGNALVHTEIVFNNVLKLYPDYKYLPELLVAAIFHDLGKPQTAESKIKDGVVRISNKMHEYKSLNFIDDYFDLFSDLTTDREMVVDIVQFHMKAHLYETGKIKKHAKLKAFEELQYFKQIMEFTQCDKSYLV